MRMMYYCEVEIVDGRVGRCTDTSKARIRKAIRGVANAAWVSVWAIPLGLYNEGKRPYGWDAPTFKSVGRLVTI